MNERDLWWKIAIVGGLAALAFATVWPVGDKIKFGIDLYGGYSLFYEIDDTGLEGAARQTLAEDVTRVLRERVDPKGVFNLVWRPVGHNRLEIQMPRPSDEVRAARRDYEGHQAQIRATLLRRSDVLRAMALTGARRDGAIEALVHGVEAPPGTAAGEGDVPPVADRRKSLLKAAAAYDAYKKMEADYEARVEQVESDNLSKTDVMTALRQAPAERSAAFEPLIRGIPERRQLLEAAAVAWEAYRVALSTSRPTETTTQPSPDSRRNKKQTFDAAVQKVLDTNADLDSQTEGPTIDKALELEDKFDLAVADVLETNMDVGRLQAALDAKPGDPFRTTELGKLTAEFPGLTPLIEGLADANDRLKERRRGEGRLEDPADLQRLLKGAGVLEFRILPERSNDPTEFSRYREDLQVRGPRPSPGEDKYQWFELEDPADFVSRRGTKKEDLERDFEDIKRSSPVVVDRFGDKYYVLSHIGDRYAMTHRPGQADWSLKSSRSTRDQNGRLAIGFRLDERGGSEFAVLTRENKERALCIFLDDLAVSHAKIQSVIRTDGQITGTFTSQQVQDMVKKLNAGSLPKKLKDPPISIRSIGPSLGEANRDAGLKAAKYGALFVAIFMILYYFYAGVIAVIAVGMNLLFIGAMMASMGATLTLPGIAGLVLAIGMAVDANVLINERIREELARGTAMRMAVKLGYERAFRAILDSNVTTVLTCVILYMLGSEEIKGFGLTLGIGVFVNLFTAYFVTRLFFELMSMVSVPKEVTRYPVYVAGGIFAFGAALYGLGYLWNAEAMRDQSVLMHFGVAIMYFGPAILGLLVLMVLARAIHRSFQKGAKPRIPMLRLIGSPNVDWIGKRHLFFGLSTVMVVGGLVLFLSMDPKNLYDIEFMGGTAAQIDLNEDSPIAQLETRDQQTEISERLRTSGASFEGYGQRLADATVTVEGDMFVIRTPGIPAARLEPVIKDVFDKRLSLVDPIRYEDPAAESMTVRLREESGLDLEAMQGIVTGDVATRFVRAGESITSAMVQAVQAVGGGAEHTSSFEIVTRETNKELVVGAIMETLQADINIQPALTFKLSHHQRGGDVPYFPIRKEDPRELGVELTEAEARAIDLQGWQGGVAIVLDRLDPPQRLDVLSKRLRAMRLQPGFETYGWRESEVFGLLPAEGGDDVYSRILVAVSDENYPMLNEQGGISPMWEKYLAEKEVELLQAALQRQTSLSQITQFDKQVSGEAQTEAYIALALSWLVIIIYVWFRFGNIRWGVAAVCALVHDVIIATGCIAATYYIADTAFGRALMLDKFRVDLGLVAALLTVIGYSVNDTIVVFDRVRENRGRLADVSRKMINDSISQTLSRTVLTLLTSLITVFIMYLFGGPGLHGFTFVLFIGLAIGTYSSIGIASQLLLRHRMAAETA